VEAILAQPDRSTLEGQRDHTLLSFLCNMGARIQEALELRPNAISTLKRTVERMQIELESAPALPLRYPGSTGPFEWHRKVLATAGESLMPPVLDDKTAAAIADKIFEYSHLAGLLKSYKERSLRSISIPKKGISYLLSENSATQAVLNAIADELGRWVNKHKFDPGFLKYDTNWGLGELLAERTDLVVALRVAQLKPVESEKLYIGINRPLFVTVSEIAIAFIPVVGNAVAAYEAYSGEDIFGYDLDVVDRAVLGVSVLLPFIGRFVKGGKALYTASRMAQLYGRDAAEWPRVMSAAERLSTTSQGIKLLQESSTAVRSGKHIGEDAARAKALAGCGKNGGMGEMFL
jgi:hypothetical protein